MVQRLTLKTENAEYELCWIPAGEFDMGSPRKEKDRESDETLHHVVLTRGFWALETPTTQALYQEIMGTNPSRFEGDNLPVETVSWNDATKFCEELTKRLPQGWTASLPTEAQWEYACRAGTKTPYWYGYVFDPDRMSDGCETTPVKSYYANAWGLYDMIGNVLEWTSDYYGDYPSETVVDPEGPQSGVYRSARGDAWDGRSASRFKFSADCRDNGLGFRFILSGDLDETKPEQLKDGQAQTSDGEWNTLVLGPRKTVERSEAGEQEGATPSPTRTPSQLADEACWFLRTGSYDEAERLASEALRFNPNSDRAARVLAEAQEKREKSRKLGQILNEGEISLNNGDYESALGKAATVLTLRPDYAAAFQLKRRAEDAILTKLLSSAEISFNNGDYKSALSKATTVLKARSDDLTARELKNRAEDAITTKLLSDGEISFNSGDYESALEKAKTVLRMRPNDKAARALIRRVEDAPFVKLLSEGEIGLNKGDYELAIRKATTILEERPDDDAALELKRRARVALRPAASPLWSPSSSREAGFRQTLKIGNAEYGFCWIPPGEFDMGSPETEEGRNDDETLHHVVLTRGFWMLETPTTQALYQEIMGENPSHFEGDNLPVETVSWYEVAKFCKELTLRLPKGLTASLPTEAQWEYGARAGAKTAYWYGDSADFSKMNCFYGKVGKTTPVKRYAPNPWGLYDVHGNVWEWCLDYYDGDYPSGTVTDPKGPTSVWPRVIRGGSWVSGARCCRSAHREDDPFDGYGDDVLGFRFLLSCD